MMKSKRIFFFVLLFSNLVFILSANAGGDNSFEFKNYISNDNDYFRQEGSRYNQCSYMFATRIDIVPEECRFYLSYQDGGKNNSELLGEAEKLKNNILEAMKSVDPENIAVEMAFYNPEQYLGSFFKSQKEEINLQFRITVKLGKDFWENSKKIAKVLDVINDVKKDQQPGKKLTQGDVRYAVKKVEPFAEELLKKTEEKIKEFKKNIVEINKSSENDLFFNVTYSEIYVEEQTLEKVTLVLPYNFTYKLKEEEKD